MNYIKLICALFSMTAALAGCSYTVSLAARDGGAISTSKVQGGASSGPMELVADGVRYTGQYVAVPSNSGFTVMTMYGRNMPSRTVSAYSGGGVQYGRAMLSGEGGKSLICEYEGTASAGGFGVCRNSDGKLFDMLISQ